MRAAKTIAALTMLVSSISGYAQRKTKESEQAFQDITNIRETFKRLPVTMNIELRNAVDPVSSAKDTVHSKMTVYIGKSEFYMKSEGLEQIVTDSLQVMINHQTMQIRLRKPVRLPSSNVSASFFTSMPQASYAQFDRKYIADQKEAGDNKTITLQSRESVKGTTLPRESITITYNRFSYDPVCIVSTGVSLALTDSVSYSALQNSPSYQGKTIKVQSEKGTLFFMARTHTLTYTFNSIIHDPNAGVVRIGDRIAAKGKGEYFPATGFEQYAIYKEF